MDQLTWQHMAGAFSIAIGFIAIGLLAILVILVNQMDNSIKKNKTIERLSTPQGKLGDVRRWVDTVDMRIKRVGIKKISGLHYALVMMVGLAISFFVGIYLFKNIIIAVLCSMAIIMCLEQVIITYERNLRDTMASQMATAARIFAAEYALTPQVERAIGAVARQCPAPLGNAFQRAYNSFMSGRNKDHVFAELAAELNFEYGQMFVHLLRMARSNSALAPMFNDLVTRITAHESLAHENRQQVTGERNLSIVMLLSPIPVYLIVRKMVPESYIFLTDTVVGKLIICLIFLNVILWAILSRATEGVDNI